MVPLTPWVYGLPPVITILTLALMVDLVERFLEYVVRAICGRDRAPPERSADLWILAALLTLALFVPGLGSVFALGLVLIVLDLVSRRERRENREKAG